jgi:NAD(P)-dependent dehydrogenase (short-subunit alcohol dehydrogenase family)
MPTLSADPIRFEGRVAIVTGAGRGLGRSHALLLAERGCRVVVNDLGDATQGDGATGSAATVAAEIEQLGGCAIADDHTVATPEGAEALVRSAIETFGRVDIVVNNAGIVRDAAFQNLTADQLNEVLSVHLCGAVYVTKAAWLSLREQHFGRVIMTASNSGIIGNFGQANYAAAKMALIGLTRVLAREGSKYNIKVNAIAPIAITRIESRASTAIREQIEPLRERLEPSLVSPVVAWLAHESCTCSGEIFSAGGGRVARYFIGLTRGYFNDQLSPEDVRDNQFEITVEDGYLVPLTLQHELETIVSMYSQRDGGPA